VTSCDIPKLSLIRGLSFLYCKAFKVDRIRRASRMFLCHSECSFWDSKWSPEHLNMPPSETSSLPTFACSTPLLGDPQETLPEALPPSHPWWTSRLSNSYCYWASQFFLHNTFLRAIPRQGCQSGATTSEDSYLNYLVGVNWFPIELTEALELLYDILLFEHIHHWMDKYLFSLACF